jgi:hypothetical protein
MKICAKCKENKDDKDFYTFKDRWKTRLSSYCKDCQNTYNMSKYHLINRLDDSFKYRSYVNTINYVRKNRFKISAQQKLHYKIKKGLIDKEVCFICDNPEAEAHHFDYNKPLEVFWLCHKHHKWIHLDTI